MAVVVLVRLLGAGFARCWYMLYLRSVPGVAQYPPLLLESMGVVVVLVPLVVVVLLVAMVVAKVVCGLWLQ